jgi:hypothetical protein
VFAANGYSVTAEYTPLTRTVDNPLRLTDDPGMRLPRHWPGWLFIILWAALIVALVVFGAAGSDCAQLNGDFCERITWE